jgi:SAM-dependent methyltransferase
MDYAAQLARPFAGEAEERRERIEERLAPAPFLAEPLRRLNYDCSEGWAWENYRPAVLAFANACRRGGRARVLEIGGGRQPLFTPAEAAAAGIDLTVNDIDDRELSFGPSEFAHARFDIAGSIDPALHGGFDVIISRMVMEHVRNAPKAWANMRQLLAPGGVAMAFHPTLFSPPFIVNWLIPEALSARALRLLFPNRHDGDYPKFPALYELCVTSPASTDAIFKACGFSQHLVAPIWGHGYFRSLPGIREADQALQRLAEQRDWRWMTSYAYTLAQR